MGKKNKKKGLGSAKTEAKAAKKAEKAAKKARAATGDKDVEAYLAEIEAREEAAEEVTVHTDVPAPSPRTSFSMVASPVREDNLIMFGGERFTGDKGEFYADLYEFHTEKRTWTRYASTIRPAPRSSHAVAVYKHWMYLFGGEFSNPSLSQYKHFKDLWRLDLTDMEWERIDIRGGPTARSGHRMAVARGKLFVFGGFMDSGYDSVKHYNDLYYVDLQADDLAWKKVEFSSFDIVPSPRSGFQWGVVDNDIILYGGYSRELVKSAKNISHKQKKKGGGAVEQAMQARGIVQTDLYRLSTETMKFNKIKKSGYGPSARSGFGMTVFKGNLVVFGGVEDDENEADLESVFHADLFALDMKRRKWYPMTLRRKGGKKRRRRRKGAGPSSAGANVEMVENEEAPGTQVMDIVDDDATEVQAEEDDGEELDTEKMEAALKEQEEEELAPCGRFNANVALVKNVLYIAGGCVEKEEEEITLDDIWAIDLSKLDEFQQVKKLSDECTKWVASDSEEENAEDEEMENVEEEDGNMEDDSDEENSRSKRLDRRDRLRKRMENTGGDKLTPMVNEKLKDFFERTKNDWIGEVHEALGIGGKELRREAFGWAYKRYWEIKPSLRELELLEAELKAEEELEKQFAQAELESKRARSRR